LGERENIVTPGDEVSVIEEYSPGDGVYEDEHGFVRSLYTGRTFYDFVNRIVNVRTAKKPATNLEPGDQVVGFVDHIRNDLVILNLYAKVKVRGRWVVINEFSGTLTGLLFISNIADEHVHDIYDYYGVGDLVVAQVTGSYNPYHLTTKKPYLGVIFSVCPYCGGVMKPKEDRFMICQSCGARVKRKAALNKYSSEIVAGLRRMLSFNIY